SRVASRFPAPPGSSQRRQVDTDSDEMSAAASDARVMSRKASSATMPTSTGSTIRTANGSITRGSRVRRHDTTPARAAGHRRAAGGRALRLELLVERDLSVQQLGHRTAALRVLGSRLEGLLV